MIEEDRVGKYIVREEVERITIRRKIYDIEISNSTKKDTENRPLVWRDAGGEVRCVGNTLQNP